MCKRKFQNEKENKFYLFSFWKLWTKWGKKIFQVWTVDPSFSLGRKLFQVFRPQNKQVTLSRQKCALGKREMFWQFILSQSFYISFIVAEASFPMTYAKQVLWQPRKWETSTMILCQKASDLTSNQLRHDQIHYLLW